MFGDKFVIHSTEQKPTKTGPQVEGFSSFKWMINTPFSKVGFGSVLDATAWVNFSE
jgi:hypothetical protein